MHDKLKKLLCEMPKKRASDIHITANSPIHYRIDDELIPTDDKVLSPAEAKEMVYSLMDEIRIRKFEDEKEMDFSFSIEGVARFRANVFFQRSFIGCAVRMIPFEIMDLETCGLPVDIVRKFCQSPRGLVLVTGATGSGKSTTLAGMVDEINKARRCHIITVEDPIEFVHENKNSLIDQREVWNDTHSFNNALRHVLREDPDVILIGELRDLESIHQAMVIADTGHLVLATLHTSDSVQTINRIIDVFPAHQQRQIRTQLSFVLLGIIAQQLIPRADKKGQVLATEILVATPSIRSLIRDDKAHQIYSAIQTAQKMGMKTMNQSVADLCRSGVISYQDALSRSSNVDELEKLLDVKGE